MIKTFIFVEDGSVDLDELKNNVGDDVFVITYRQGSMRPEIQQPRESLFRNGTINLIVKQRRFLKKFSTVTIK
mgnify:CR=1 FL=1